jgi:hypothetical protein
LHKHQQHQLRKKKPSQPQQLLQPSQLTKRLSLPKAKLSQPIRKAKLLRSNPLRKSLLLEHNDLGFLIDDESVYIGYRRPEIVKDNIDDDIDLSEEIRWKLFLARQLALMRYKEIHG